MKNKVKENIILPSMMMDKEEFKVKRKIGWGLECTQ